VDLIISAMETVGAREIEHRETPRRQYRTNAWLRLFSDADDAPLWRLFTRDVNHRSLGFITSHRLPLGYGGWVELPDPAGDALKVNCTLFRCRQISTGWYEGAMYFNRNQMCFATHG
jgi:hypothetical protein